MVILGSASPVIGPSALFLILNSYYIPFEEKMMSESFAGEWETYSAAFHDFDDYERLVATARETDWQTYLIVLLGGEAGARSPGR